MLFANITIASIILSNKHKDTQFLTMYKNEFLLLFKQADFCLRLNGDMLAALLLAFDNEELPAEFAYIAQHNPVLVKNIGSRNLTKHWVLYEVIYTSQAREGTLSREQLTPVQQSLNPACRVWMNTFYMAHVNNKNIVRLMLNDANVDTVIQHFPLFKPLLENDRVTEADLNKFYDAQSSEIDAVLSAPNNQLKTASYLQNKFCQESREMVCQRIQLFAFLSNNAYFCTQNLRQLIKFFSKEGHTLIQIKANLMALFRENPELIKAFVAECDHAIIYHNIELMLPVCAKKNIRLNTEDLIKLSYAGHDEIYCYLYEDPAFFDIFKDHLPIDNNHLDGMLRLLAKITRRTFAK